MRELSYVISGKRDTRTYTTVYIFLSMLVALVVGLLSGATVGAVFHFLVCLVAVILVWLFVRFCLTSYTYQVAPTAEGWMFSVTVTQGKKTTTLCRMPLEQLVGVDYLTHKSHKKKYASSPAMFRYLFHFRPTHLCRLTFLEQSQKTEILIESDEMFAKGLQNLLLFLGEDGVSPN